MALGVDLGLAAVNERPRLRPDVVFRKLPGLEGPHVIVKDPERQKYYNFEAWEYDLLSLLDGTRAPEQIAAEFHKHHPTMEVDQQYVIDYVEGLRQTGLMEQSEQERHLAMVDRARTSRRKRFYDVERSTLFQILIPMFDPDRLMDRFVGYIRWWWAPWFVGLWMVVFTAVLGFLLRYWDLYWAGFFSLIDVRSNTFWDWIGLFTIGFAVSIWHELGHGFTCKRFGGEVHSIGIMIFYLQPAFYCAVDDSYMFPNRFHRIYAALGGSYFELMLCSVATGVWLMTPVEWWIHGLALTVVFFSGLSLIAFNLNPLIKLDGYYVLMDLLNAPGLREDSFDYLGGLLRKHVLHLSVASKPISRRRRRIYLTYGICSVLYTALVLVITFYLMQTWLVDWLGPAGYLAMVGLTVLALRRKLVSGVRLAKHVWLDKREVLLTRTGVVLIGLGAALTLLLLLLPRTDTRTEAAFEVEPGSRAAVRAPMDGLVRAVLVEEGTRVSLGARLALLENSDLPAAMRLAASDAVRLRREGAAAQMRQDAVLARTLNLHALEAEARRALIEERMGLREIISPIEGMVTTPDLDQIVGRYLKQGEMLCFVDRLDTVKLAVSVSEGDMEEIGVQTPVRMMVSAYPGRTLRGNVRSVSPAAHEPLAGAHDRPDLVRRANLVRVMIEISNPDELLRPAMSGRVQFLTQPRSIAGKAWWRMRRWIASIVW